MRWRICNNICAWLQVDSECSSLTSSSLFCSTFGLCISPDGQLGVPLSLPAPPTPPNITLIGPALVQLPVGTAYKKCPNPQPPVGICDRSGPACAHMNSQSLQCTSLHSSPEAPCGTHRCAGSNHQCWHA